MENSLAGFWTWANGRTFQVKGARIRVRVQRGNAIYPYPHVSTRRYADILDGSGDSYDLDYPESEILTALFWRFERLCARAGFPYVKNLGD